MPTSYSTNGGSVLFGAVGDIASWTTARAVESRSQGVRVGYFLPVLKLVGQAAVQEEAARGPLVQGAKAP